MRSGLAHRSRLTLHGELDAASGGRLQGLLALGRLANIVVAQTGCRQCVSVPRALTLRAASVQIWGSGSLERRHGAALEPLAQRIDARRGVGASYAYIGFDTTDSVVAETANDENDRATGVIGASHIGQGGERT